MADTSKSRYFVEMAARTLDVLESFDSYEEKLTIREVAERVRVPYTSALRLLYTLEMRGYVSRPAGSKKFVRTPARKRFRIGYAALDHRIRFSQEVSHSVVLAARRSGLDLIVKDNAQSPQVALSNADLFLDQKVDLMILHQLDETAAHLISAKCDAADVPVIAVNFAQPGAYYFGGNNYYAGRMAGEYLCDYAKKEWSGKFDKVIIMRAQGMGSTQEVRRAGTYDSLTKLFGKLPSERIIDAVPGTTARDGYHEIKRILTKIGARSKRVLVTVMSDALALGCSRAVEDMCIAERVAIIGHGGAKDGRKWLRRYSPANALIAYFPETYGDRVITIALTILANEKVPMLSYTNHIVLTSSNLNQYYLKDKQM